jgi:MinD superfamily P-loop ATPase
MKEIVIISGKGGTGKTSVAAALAFIAESAMVADCDVDASDLHLILKPDILQRENFYSGVKAEIIAEKCIACGKCEQVCRFNAIFQKANTYTVNAQDCEGCGYCYHVCAVDAISLPEQKVGECYISETKLGLKLIHARLSSGADNSGKLVARVKKQAKALVDGSPGIGCPVISSLSGADFVLLVTEPTLSGLSDLKRVWELAKKFNIPGGCIINKADINPEIALKTEAYLQEENILLLDKILYDEDFYRSMTLGTSLVEFNPAKWRPGFEGIWQQIKKEIQ